MRWTRDATALSGAFMDGVRRRVEEKAVATAKRRGQEAVGVDDIHIAFGEVGKDIKECVEAADGLAKWILNGL